MKINFHRLLNVVAAFVLGVATTPANAQQPCDSGVTGEGRVAQHAENVNALWNKLFSAYQGDKREEENLEKQNGHASEDKQDAGGPAPQCER